MLNRELGILLCSNWREPAADLLRKSNLQEQIARGNLNLTLRKSPTKISALSGGRMP